MSEKCEHGFKPPCPENYPFTGPHADECTGAENGQHVYAESVCGNCGHVSREALAAAEERGRRRGVEERDERVRLYQLFVLAAHWLLAGLQRDLEASEPAVLLYTPLRAAALRVLNAFQPPGTVRNFTGPESSALNDLAAAARDSATAPDKPLGGESGEWWKAALASLDLPSIPWGDEMATLRAALAPRDSGKEG